MRVTTSATECASVASVLRPCPVLNDRARADSLGGTSTTCSPSARSRTRCACRRRRSPRSPRPGQATGWRSGASRRSRHGRCRTVPCRGWSRRRSSPRWSPSACAGPCRSRPGQALLMCSRLSSDARSITGCRAGRATLLRAGQSPLVSLLALATPGSRRPNESHTTSVGSRNESDDPGAWTEPRQAPVLGQWNKQPMRGRGDKGLGGLPAGSGQWCACRGCRGRSRGFHLAEECTS